MPQDIRIVFLGTSSGTPARDRNVSALCVVIDGAVLLFDCGEGTQHQFLRAPVRSGAIDAIFITHVHGDHSYGLPGLLATLSMNGRTRPMTIVGPPGVRDYLEGVLATTQHNPDFSMAFAETPFRGEGYTVISAPLEHTVETFGYCVIEDEHRGKFDPQKARALGFEAGPQFAELIRSGDPRVVGPSRPGRRIAYVSDTRPCANGVELARGADVVIHESTYAHDMSDDAHARFHSTAVGAARVAAEANASALILTHFSARYGDVTPLVDEAQAVFQNTTAASDLAVFEVHANH
jgi:ribonuclease Z